MTTTAQFSEIDVGLIDVSWNPRKTFHVDSLKELAASIKTEGVLEPIRVRPSPTTRGRYDLVFGERRLRACKLAGVTRIPAMIKDMTDRQATEAKAVENDQREDVHPLEQADCYQRLLVPPADADESWQPLAIDEIAARVGRPVQFIAQRLRLIDLHASVRTALSDGRIGIGVALEIARLPVTQQADCLEHAENINYGDAVTAEDVRSLIRDQYLLKLSLATFDTKDAKLIPAAGACGTCPKRTGAQKELFADVAKGDLCTDAACWTAKKEANWAAIAADHEAKGGKVLTAKQSAGMFHDGRLNHWAKAFELTAKCQDDPRKRTYKQLLGKTAIEHARLADNGKGNGVLLVMEKDVAHALKAAGHKFADKMVKREKARASGAASYGSAEWEAKEDKRKKKQDAEERVTHAVVGAIAEAAADMKLVALVDALLPVLIVHGPIGDVADRRGWVTGNGRHFFKSKAFSEKVRAMSPIERVGVFVELHVIEDAGAWDGKIHPGLIASAKAFGVDVGKVREKVTLDVASKSAAKKGKKKK